MYVGLPCLCHLKTKQNKTKILASRDLKKKNAESLKSVPYDFLFNTQKELNYTLFLRVFQKEWN